LIVARARVKGIQSHLIVSIKTLSNAFIVMAMGTCKYVMHVMEQAIIHITLHALMMDVSNGVPDAMEINILK